MGAKACLLTVHKAFISGMESHAYDTAEPRRRRRSTKRERRPPTELQLRRKLANETQLEVATRLGRSTYWLSIAERHPERLSAEDRRRIEEAILSIAAERAAGGAA